jgi:hypothetical protein
MLMPKREPSAAGAAAAERLAGFVELAKRKKRLKA